MFFDETNVKKKLIKCLFQVVPDLTRYFLKYIALLFSAFFLAKPANTDQVNVIFKKQILSIQDIGLYRYAIVLEIINILIGKQCAIEPCTPRAILKSHISYIF